MKLIRFNAYRVLTILLNARSVGAKLWQISLPCIFCPIFLVVKNYAKQIFFPR
jgi:hypothetical protein